MTTARAVPFYCPYCGDEDLRPHGVTHGEWECRACLRGFSLKYLGMFHPAHETTHEATHEAAQEGGPR